MFIKIRQSIENPDDHMLTWLDRLDTFANHVSAARRLSIVELDRAALTLGLEGHSTPRFHDGKPVFVTDMQVAADALTLEDWAWEGAYPARKRDDIYARDADGKLVQEMVTSPPNAQLVSKLLSNLHPGPYSERSDRRAPSFRQCVDRRPDGATPTVIIAHLRRSMPSAQWLRQRSNSVRRTCLRFQGPASMWRNSTPSITTRSFCESSRCSATADRKLLPPLPSDVVIAGSRQHLAFSDAQIPVEAVRAETLLDEGYQNPELYELAPAWKPKKPKPPTDAERAEIAKQAATEMAKEKPYRSMEDRAEGIGRGTPAPNGRRVSP